MKYQKPYGSVDPDAPYVDYSAGVNSGSKIPAGFPNWTQREIVDVISKAGLAPDDVLQLASAIQSQKLNYVVAAGSANTITGAFSPSLATADYRAGLVLNLLVAANNTGAATFNGKAIVNNNGGAFIGNELVAGNIASMIYDGTRFRLVGTSKGRILNTQVFKTAGVFVYTPTPGTQYVDVEVQGGGGAGGGTPATGASQLSIAGGGGSGAWAKKLITSGFSGVNVTVGVGGAGVVGGTGGNGGASSFGGIVSANGGNAGGTAGPASNTSNFNTSGGAGGIVGASGDINAAGISGLGVLMVSGTGTQAISAASKFAGGPGAGGQGGSSPASTAAQVGASGQPGIVIVTEYA